MKKKNLLTIPQIYIVAQNHKLTKAQERYIPSAGKLYPPSVNNPASSLYIPHHATQLIGFGRANNATHLPPLPTSTSSICSSNTSYHIRFLCAARWVTLQCYFHTQQRPEARPAEERWKLPRRPQLLLNLSKSRCRGLLYGGDILHT